METLTRRLLAVLCLAALCLTGCGAASSAGTATPETAAATPETAVPALAGPLTPLRQDDGQVFYSIVPAGLSRTEGVVCRLDASGVQTPLCPWSHCSHDGTQCPAWLADRYVYLLFVLDGTPHLFYRGADQADWEARQEWNRELIDGLGGGGDYDQAAAAQDAREQLYRQPPRLERLDPVTGVRDWLCEFPDLDDDQAMRLHYSLRGELYTDGQALYGSYTSGENCARLMRLGLDGSVSVRPLPRAESSTVYAMAGSCVLYLHIRSPVDLRSLELAGNTNLVNQLSNSVSYDYRLWDLATGEDRLLYTESAWQGAQSPLTFEWMTPRRAYWNRTIFDGEAADRRSTGLDFVVMDLTGDQMEQTTWTRGADQYTYECVNFGTRDDGTDIYAALRVMSPVSGEVWVFDAATGQALTAFALPDTLGEGACPRALLEGEWVVCGSWVDDTVITALLPLESLLNGDTRTGALPVTGWQPDPVLAEAPSG